MGRLADATGCAAPAPLREPHLDFEVKDGDMYPDRSYRIIAKYRRTGGGGTFGDFETNWWPTEGARTVIKIVGAPGPQTVELTDENPDEPGPLKSWETDWFGTHTFDIWVEKYHGSTQVDSYMLKGPYSLWVPEEEAPDGKPGHAMQWADAADGSLEWRADYWLHDQRGKPASEAALVALTHGLAEIGTTDAPTQTGVRIGGVDADEDGDFDGVVAYRAAGEDLPKRLIWLCADSTGAPSAIRRTHDNRRMLCANGKNPYCYSYAQSGDEFLRAARCIRDRAAEIAGTVNLVNPSPADATKEAHHGPYPGGPEVLEQIKAYRPELIAFNAHGTVGGGGICQPGKHWLVARCNSPAAISYH